MLDGEQYVTIIAERQRRWVPGGVARMSDEGAEPAAAGKEIDGGRSWRKDEEQMLSELNGPSSSDDVLTKGTGEWVGGEKCRIVEGFGGIGSQEGSKGHW